MSDRNRFYTEFNGVYTSGGDDEEVEGDEDGDNQQHTRRSIGDGQSRVRDEINKRFQWFIILNDLSNNDILKFDSILNLERRFVFNYLSAKISLKGG